MMRELERFWNDETGAEFVEWAVVVIMLLAPQGIVGLVRDLRRTGRPRQGA